MEASGYGRLNLEEKCLLLVYTLGWMGLRAVLEASKKEKRFHRPGTGLWSAASQFMAIFRDARARTLINIYHCAEMKRFYGKNFEIG
jgi:hypothetical protein